MPRTIKYNGASHQFPDDASDDEIRSALEASDKPIAQAPEPKTVAGFAGNVVSSGGKFLSNLGTGVLDLGGRGVQAVLDPAGAYKDLKESHPLDAISAMGRYVKSRYGGVQKSLDTAYEDPVGVASDLSTVAGGVGLAGKVGALAKVPMAARVGRAAMAVSDATNPLNLSRVPMALARKVPGVAGKIQESAADMYQSALKPPPSTPIEDVGAMVTTGLRDRIPASRGGLKSTRAAIDKIDETVKSAIDAAASEGKVLDPEAVAKRTSRSKEFYSRSSNPESDVAAVDNSKDEFLRKHSYEAPFTEVRPATEYEGYVPVGEGSTRVPKPIPIDEGQAEKQANYKKIRDSSYGELATPAKESLKDISRGLKEDIYSQLPPEVQHLGPKEKILIDIEGALERFVNREANKNKIPLPTAASRYIPMAVLTKIIDGSPLIKSKLAMWMSSPKPTSPLRRIGPPAAMYGAQNPQQ